MTDEKVTKLPVRHKKKSEGRFLVIKHSECRHDQHAVLVDRSLEYVECEGCGERLNPIDVLMRMARKETEWNMIRERYQDEMRRLDERSRTKCQHCGKMTAISRR